MHGFSIRDAVKFSIFLVNYNATRGQWVFNNHVSTDLDRLETKEDELSIRLDNAAEGEDNIWRSEWESFARDCELIEAIHDDMGSYSDVLWMTKDNLFKHLPKDLNKKKFDQYLDRMSLEVGQGSDVAIGNYRYPYDFNPIHKHSIFKVGKKVHCP